MKHEKTFAAIEKLKEIEIELHRLKNALELANKIIDAKKPWVGLTEIEIVDIEAEEFTSASSETFSFARAIEYKLKEKNT